MLFISSSIIYALCLCAFHNYIILKFLLKSKPITNEERQIILQAYKEIRSSAVMLEQYLDEKGIHIGHNRIHKILLEAKLAKEEDRKKRR